MSAVAKYLAPAPLVTQTAFEAGATAERARIIAMISRRADTVEAIGAVEPQHATLRCVATAIGRLGAP